MSDHDATCYVYLGEDVHAEPSATSRFTPPIFQTTAYRYDSTD